MQDLEEKYKFLLNRENPRFEELRQQVVDNNFYCPNKSREEDNRCFCREFFNRDEDCVCGCGIYKKVARTEEEIIAWNTPFKYTTD